MNYKKNGPARPRTCEVCYHYMPQTRGRGICERRVSNGGIGSTLRVKTCPFFTAIKKTDQTIMFDLGTSKIKNGEENSKEKMIVAIRLVEKEMISKIDTEIKQLENRIFELNASIENYKLGVAAAIDAVINS